MVLRDQTEGQLHPEHPLQPPISLIALVIVMGIAQRILSPEIPRPDLNARDTMQKFLQGSNP